jgi:hypothetical protein
LQFYNSRRVFVTRQCAESTNTRIFWFSILEMLAMVAVSAFQVDRELRRSMPLTLGKL